MTSEMQIKDSMDRMYRWTRHVYDASRKYYLLGRDYLITQLHAKPDEVVCEVGCGTARNLIKMAKAYPQAEFVGLDASGEMLKTAQKSLQSKRMDGRIQLAQAYAQSFKPEDLFRLSKPLDKIVLSYALSIIPPWRESLDHCLAVIRNGGELHIIDFGPQDKLPGSFRAFLFWFLSKFHVYYKPEILEYLKRLEHEKKGTLDYTPLYGGYAYHAIFRKG